MEFFIPGLEDKPEKAEELLKSIRDFAKTTVGWGVSNRRIFRISYYHDGKHYEDEVGKKDDVNRELVIAILEANPVYLVCTPNRGVLRGMPILVGFHDTISIEDFDTQKKKSPSN